MALESLRAHRSVFLVGPPGSGKFQTVHKAVQMLRPEVDHVLWTTARDEVDRLRMFSYGIEPLSALMLNVQVASLITARSVLLVVHDAMSMNFRSLRAISNTFRALRSSDEPFGGVLCLFTAREHEALELSETSLRSMRAWFDSFLVVHDTLPVGISPNSGAYLAATLDCQESCDAFHSLFRADAPSDTVNLSAFSSEQVSLPTADLIHVPPSLQGQQQLVNYITMRTKVALTLLRRVFSSPGPLKVGCRCIVPSRNGIAQLATIQEIIMGENAHETLGAALLEAVPSRKKGLDIKTPRLRIRIDDDSEVIDLKPSVLYVALGSMFANDGPALFGAVAFFPIVGMGVPPGLSLTEDQVRHFRIPFSLSVELPRTALTDATTCSVFIRRLFTALDASEWWFNVAVFAGAAFPHLERELARASPGLRFPRGRITYRRVEKLYK